MKIGNYEIEVNQDGALNLIINGIDHGKFDIEWAKRGGVVYHYGDFCRYICDGDNYNDIRAGQDGEFLIGEEKTVGLVSILTTEKVENSPYYLRMATPYECAEAGIEYIEPPARWLPIESAPKDGRRILIKKYGTIFVAGWGYVVDDIYGWVIVNDCYIEHSDNLLWMEPYSLFIGGKHGI